MSCKNSTLILNQDCKSEMTDLIKVIFRTAFTGFGKQFWLNVEYVCDYRLSYNYKLQYTQIQSIILLICRQWIKRIAWTAKRINFKQANSIIYNLRQLAIE